jgi:predicted branched-subunit amino acid permease
MFHHLPYAVATLTASHKSTAEITAMMFAIMLRFMMYGFNCNDYLYAKCKVNLYLCLTAAKVVANSVAVMWNEADVRLDS